MFSLPEDKLFPLPPEKLAFSLNTESGRLYVLASFNGGVVLLNTILTARYGLGLNLCLHLGGLERLCRSGFSRNHFKRSEIPISNPKKMATQNLSTSSLHAHFEQYEQMQQKEGCILC